MTDHVHVFPGARAPWHPLTTKERSVRVVLTGRKMAPVLGNTEERNMAAWTGKSRVLLAVFFCAAVPMLVPPQARAEESPPAPPEALPATAEATMDALHAQVFHRPPGTDYSPLKEQALVDHLASFGLDAVPAILARIKEEDNGQMLHLYWSALGRIPGEELDHILMDIFLNGELRRESALNILASRRARFGPLSFPLSDAAINLLVDRINTPEKVYIGSAMVMLGMCDRNDPGKRFPPILNRFAADVRYDGEYPKNTMTYLSPRTASLAGYLSAFRSMGETAWPPLRAAIQEARNRGDAEVEKWLCMAAGYACDPEAADALKQVVLHDPDRYVRLLAIRAYARSAGQQAVPVLESLLDDPTVEIYNVHPFAPPRKIIGMTARAELYRLAHPDECDDCCRSTSGGGE